MRKVIFRIFIIAMKSHEKTKTSVSLSTLSGFPNPVIVIIGKTVYKYMVSFIKKTEGTVAFSKLYSNMSSLELILIWSGPAQEITKVIEKVMR